MLRIEFEDAKNWLDLLDAIRDIVEEAVFTATQEGLSLRAMDSARVAMIDLKLPVVYFPDFKVEEEKVSFAISVADMVKSLKGIKKGYRLVLELKENILRLEFIGKGRHAFEFPLLDISPESIPSLKLNFEAHVKIETDIIGNAIKNIEKFSDYIRFKATSDRLVLHGKSEKGRASSEFLRDELISLDVIKECEASYSTEYLMNILGRSELSEVTSIEFGNRMPLKATYTLAGEGEVSYYLAPRTETELE